MSVGVAEGGTEVGGIGVSVKGTDIGTDVGDMTVAVGKISALKLQALNNNELTTSKTIDSKYFWFFIKALFSY